MSKTPARKKTKFDVASIAVLFLPVAFLIGIGAGYLLWGTGSGSASGAKALAALLDPGDDPALGPKKAKVIIVEFSDYQCPFCKMWHEQVYHQLLATYGDKVRFVYRDFPLEQIHPGAEPAAEAANCALDQNKYWEYHDAIFSDNYDLTRDGFLKIASELGLDTKIFASCIDGRKYASEIQQDYQDGIALKVGGTPTVFINGIRVPDSSLYSFAAYKATIDQILAGK